MVFRKKIFVESGGYDIGSYVWEDYELWLRLGRKYKMANLPDYAVAYRMHNGGLSQKNDVKNRIELIKIINKNRKYYPGYFSTLIKTYIFLFISFFRFLNIFNIL